MNRDPIEERGGLNLYGFVYNDPTNYIDVLGGIPKPLVASDGIGPGRAQLNDLQEAERARLRRDGNDVDLTKVLAAVGKTEDAQFLYEVVDFWVPVRDLSAGNYACAAVSFSPLGKGAKIVKLLGKAKNVCGKAASGVCKMWKKQRAVVKVPKGGSKPFGGTLFWRITDEINLKSSCCHGVGNI